MIQGRDIVYVSSIEWGNLWQAHQEVALRLAAAGNRVLYVENTGVRGPSARDAGRVARRLRRWARALGSGGVREVAPNIYVCSPVVMPPFGPRWRRAANRRLFLPALLSTARRLGMRDVLLWTYLPNDTTLDLMEALGRDCAARVYYCAADFSQLASDPEKLGEAERAIVAGCEVVFANCAELARRFAPWNPNVHVFPVGVNLAAFPAEPHAPAGGAGPEREWDGGGAGAASEVGALPGPVIGYVGGLHRHVDWGLVEEMALSRRGWSWVFVGPVQSPVERLAGLPNVHLLGERPHAALAAYVRRFDVCIVPYVNSAYTATVVPTKINEYLALGKPVVSTALPAVAEFNAEHRVLLTAEAEAGSFLGAIEQALALPKDEETLRRRRRVAALGDWDERLPAMCRLIEESLRGGAGRKPSEAAARAGAAAGRG